MKLARRFIKLNAAFFSLLWNINTGSGDGFVFHRQATFWHWCSIP